MAVLLIAAVSIFSWELIGVILQEHAPKQKTEIEAMIEHGQRLVAQTCQSIENTIKASRAALSTTSFSETDYGKSVIDLDDVGGTSYLQILYIANIVIKDTTTTEGFVLNPANEEKHMPESKFAYKITNDKVYVDLYNENGITGLTFSYNDTETKWVCEYFNFDGNRATIYIFGGKLTVADETPMMDKLEIVCAELADGKNYQGSLVNTDFNLLSYFKIDATSTDGIIKQTGTGSPIDFESETLPGIKMDDTNKDDFTAVVGLINRIANDAYNPDYTNRDFKEKNVLDLVMEAVINSGLMG